MQPRSPIQRSRHLLPGLSFPLAITVISWALNFVALKILYPEVPPPAVALVRFGGMYAFLVAMCKVQGLKLRFDRKDAFPIMLLGFVSMGVYMILFLEGMSRTSPNEGAIILATAPIFTGLVAVAFRQERFSPGALFGAIVAFCGVVLVVMESARSADNRFLGDVMIFVSSIVWAYCAVLMKSLVGRYHPVQLLTLAMPAALVLLIPYGLQAVVATPWRHLSGLSWLLIVHLAVISGAFGFAGFYAGVRQIGAGGAMLYQYFVPPLTVLFAWWLMGTPLIGKQLIGLAVVITGVAVSMHFRTAAQVKLEPEPA